MDDFTDLDIAELLHVIPTLSVPPASPAVSCKRVLIVGGSIGGLAAAACLRAAGFGDVKVVERSRTLQAGAGLGLDDASVAVLKGLSLATGVDLSATVDLQRLRWTEERTAEGKVLVRQPMPSCAALYSELQSGLARLLPQGTVTYGRKAVSDESLSGAVRVHFEDGEPLDCDLLIAADGPRSIFRSRVQGGSTPMRFAGYCAWRGTVPWQELPPETRSALTGRYPDLGNCLYFVMCAEPRQHAVLYDIGKGLVNWLVYVNRSTPLAGPGQTTSAAPPGEIDRLRSTARSHWGDGLGGVIEVTEEPFWNDIYDLEEPLGAFCDGALTLLGDAAHAITPHMAKGSNLAIHDAFAIACAASGAKSVAGMLQEYSSARVQECSRCLLLSRHLGRLRNGLLADPALPQDRESFEALLHSARLETRALPLGDLFRPVWDFARRVPSGLRGFFLSEGPARAEVSAASTKRKADAADLSPASGRAAPSLRLTAVNHVSRETGDVERLRRFYSAVLGLPEISRPDFGFGGAWLQLPSGVALHIIERDPEKPSASAGQTLQDADLSQAGAIPARFIRRSHHIALTVPDVDAAKATLAAHGVSFAVNGVPGTEIVQLFFHDPDGNGVEIGNFDG